MQILMALAVAGVLMLAGCGGGGSKGGAGAGMPSNSTPTRTYGPGPNPLPLPTGYTLERDSLRTGQALTVEGTDGQRTRIRCTAGSPDCRFRVFDDGTATLIAGNIEIEIVGVPTVTPPTTTLPTLTLPSGHRLEIGTGTILPGEHWTLIAETIYQHEDADLRIVEETVLGCPSGGRACVVTVLPDGRIGYRSVRPAVGRRRLLLYAHYPFPPFAAGTITTIPPGESRTTYEHSHRNARGHTTFSCPTGGQACVVTVQPDGLTTLTGGTPRLSSQKYLVDVGNVPPNEEFYTRTRPLQIPDLPARFRPPAGTIILFPGEGWPLGASYLSIGFDCRHTEDWACVIRVAADGTVTVTGGVVSRGTSNRPDSVRVAEVTGYGRWSSSNYDFISAFLFRNSPLQHNSDSTQQLVLDPAYHRFSPSSNEQLTFQGNAYSTDGLTGQITLNYNRGTVDASINDSSINLFSMSGIPVTGANFWKADGTGSSLQGSFVRRTDGTGVDRAVGIAATSSRAMAFDIPETSR